jgi:toxin CptA
VPWALSLSNLPAPRWQWAAGAVVLAALVEAAWQVRRRPRHLLVPPGEAAVMVDGRPVEAFAVRFRGPLVQLRWRQGWQRHALLFWPDTLPAAQRRELRLAVSRRCISRSRRAMAP